MQARRLVARLLSLIVVFVALTLAGCSGTSSGGVNTVESPSLPLAEPDELNLAAPGELAALLSWPRVASYTEDDLIKHGRQFEPALPKNNVSVIADPVWFEPDWPAGGSAGLAYCCYSFAIPGYAEEPEVLLDWAIPPSDYSTVYVGLADWGLNCWRWFAENPDGPVALPSMEPYIDGAGQLMLIVAVASSESCNLRWIRVGSMPETIAQLDLSAHDGVAPLVLDLAGYNSDPGVGEIIYYEWDFEGDGEYDSESDFINFEVHIYDSPGDYNPGLRITTDYGVQATDSEQLHVVQGWDHSFGSIGNDYLAGVASDGEAIYCVGDSQYYDFDMLLLKYSMDGAFQWAHAWGGPTGSTSGEGVVVDGNGGAYTLARTKSFGLTDEGLALQKWGADGLPLWTTVWETANADQWVKMAVLDDAIYVIGALEEEGLLDSIAAKFDLSGNVVWAKRYGIPADDAGVDIAVVHPPGEGLQIHVVSSCEDPGPGGMIYCRFSSDGVLQDARQWTSVTDAVYPEAIHVSLLPAQVFIAGDIGGSDEETFLIEQVESGATIARAWTDNTGKVQYTYALCEVGGLLIIGRRFDGDPALMKVSKNGNLISASSYLLPDDQGWVEDLVPVYDKGLIVASSVNCGADGEWTPAALTARTITGSWAPVTISITDIVGTSSSPSGVLTVIVDGVHDAGGGGYDGLVSLAAVP